MNPKPNTPPKNSFLMYVGHKYNITCPPRVVNMVQIH